MNQTDPTADEPDTCRPVEIDGEIIRVRGAAEMSDEFRAALAEVIAAAKRKFEVEHPQTEPTDPERRERYAAALYATLEVSPTRHPWETLSPIRRAVWYARADAAMTVADEEARAAVSAVVSPPPSRAAEELAKHVTRSIFALKTPSPDGSTHYQSGWDDGLEAAMDAARDAVLAVLPEQADRAAVLREAATIAESLRQFERCTGARAAAQVSENVGILRVATALRRLAVEAHDTGTQQPEVVPCVRPEPHPPHLHSGLRDGGVVHGRCPGGSSAPAPVAQQPRAVPPGCWYNAEAAEEAMRDEPLDEPGPAAQQPAPCGDPQHRHIGPCHVYASLASGGAEQQPAFDDDEETRRG